MAYSKARRLSQLLGSDGTVPAGKIPADAIDGTKIADNAINSEHYADGSIDTAHIAADQITNALIPDNAINSEHYTDGSIDTAHIAADQITSALIADDQIDSEHIVDGSIDLAHMSVNSIDSDQYVDGSIDLIHMSANSIDSDQYVDGSIDTAHIGDDQITAAKLANTAVTAASYGSTTAIPIITVDAQGRLTSASTATISTAFTLAADSGSNDTFNTSETLTFAGTTNEIETTVSNNQIQIGLPNNVTISGNLTVSGDTTTVNTSTLAVEDPLIALATGNNAADAVDIGLYGLYDTSGSQDLYGGLFRDASDSGKWKLFKSLQAAPTTTVNTSGTGYAVDTLVANLEGNVTGNVTGNTSGTAATVTGAAQTNITSLGTLTSLTVDDITFNGSSITDAGNLTMDIGGDLNIDVDGGDINFKDGGDFIGKFKNSSNNFVVKSVYQDADLLIQGNDGGSDVTALTFDMSAAGAATFNAGVTATGLAVSGEITGVTAIRHANSNAQVIDNDNDTYFILNDPEGNNKIKIGDSGDAANTYRNTIHKFEPVSGTEYMRINASGVGIGTASPTFTAPSGSTSQKGLHIQNSGNDTSAHLRLTGHNNTGGSPGQPTYFEILHAGDALRTDFNHNGTVRMSINSAGNVGIGDASPSKKLSVNGTFSAVAGANDPALTITGSTATQSYGKINMTGAGTTVDTIRISNDGGHTICGTERNTGGGLTTGSLGYASVFGSIGSTAAHIMAANAVRMTVLSDGKVGIATTAPKDKFHIQTGGGDGQAFGGKTLSLTTSYQTGAQLAITLGDHQGCYVKVFITGDWSSHSAIAFLGEYFIQNGASGYSEPGIIIREVDNTSTVDSLSSQIVDSTDDTFQIQFKLNHTHNANTAAGKMEYQIMGQFDTIA